MSVRPAIEPVCSESSPERVVDTVIDARPRDLGGFEVQMGAAIFAPGRGIDVRPHPHIGLATVTYLFEVSQGAGR